MSLHEGKTLVKQAEDAASNKKAERRNAVGSQEQVFFKNVIELHDKYLAFVYKCFMNHTLFHKALKEAFETFCNNRIFGSSCAELLATFCNNILKKGGNGRLSDEAIDDSLEKVVKLLDYISDKDLFAEYSKIKLGQRLLFDKSVNYEHERNILTKLKQQHGGQFTSKMEKMVKDVTLAKENEFAFEEHVRTNSKDKLEINLGVTVIAHGMWPTHKFFDIKLPEEMVNCVKVFKGFYETKDNQRKLTFIYSLGTCNIIGKFDAKPVELIVSTYQACVLLLFNSSDRLSYLQIITELNLKMSENDYVEDNDDGKGRGVATHDDVIKILHYLSCAKYKILIKEPNTKKISPTDYFEFNSKFMDKMRRIMIAIPPPDDNKKITEDVAQDRKYAIDASVIRIMKSRKVLGHQDLVMECAKDLRMFKPDGKSIKKRIEDLITRDFLERDRTNHQMFRYLA